MKLPFRIVAAGLPVLVVVCVAGCASSPALPGESMGAAARSAASLQQRPSDPSAVVLDPLYIYPANPQAWAPLVKAHARTPSIPILAIADVTSEGPGKQVDPNYVSGVAQLHGAGIGVLGYVATGYGSRVLRSVETDIQHWKTWYGTEGIFLDEMPSQTGSESYYSSATAYAKSLQMSPVIGNPGTDIAESYEPTVDALIIYESPHYPSLSYLGGSWHGQYDRSHFGFIAYDQAKLDSRFDDQAEQYVLYEYVTNQTAPNPYDHFPKYLKAFVSGL